jgi:hypothetical protein
MHRTYTHYNTTAFSTPHSERSFGSTYTPADSLHSAPEQVPSTPSKQLEKNKTKEPLQDNLRGSWEEVALYQRFEAVRKVSPIFLVEIAILSFLVWRQPRKPCQWWFTETSTDEYASSGTSWRCIARMCRRIPFLVAMGKRIVRNSRLQAMLQLPQTLSQGVSTWVPERNFVPPVKPMQSHDIRAMLQLLRERNWCLSSARIA